MKTFKQLRFLLAIVAIALSVQLITPADADAQCPMCRKNVEASMDNPDTGKGFGLNAGILYLLVLPYAMTATVFYIWRRHNRKAQEAQALRKIGEADA